MRAGPCTDRPAGRDPDDRHTIDLEQWLAELHVRRLERLRALWPGARMVQLPLDLDGFW